MPTEISGSTGVNKIQDGTVVNADIDTLDASKLTGTVADARISTLTASKLSGALPAISGASLTDVNAVNTGRKNMVINGAMQVAQRATSSAGVATDGNENYLTVDRWIFAGNAAGTWTVSQDSESPVGFGNSWKMDCTTADTSLDAGSYIYLLHKIEAQDLQQLAYGTSSAKAITLSFWVRSAKTGTHIAELYHGDSSGSSKRKNSYAYTVSTANTWEKKSLTFAGDNGLAAIADDNGWGLMLTFYMAAGSNITSGTQTNDNWHNTEANRAVGQVNLADSTSNNFYLSGVQLELGSVATNYEHRTYAEELALCQRYHYEIQTGFVCTGSTGFVFNIQFPVTMRATPSQSHSYVGVANDIYKLQDAATPTFVPNGIFMDVNGLKHGYDFDGGFTAGEGYVSDWIFDAEI